MNTWLIEKNSKKPYYLKKKVFFNDLNMENTTDADYTHANRVFKGLK